VLAEMEMVLCHKMISSTVNLALPKKSGSREWPVQRKLVWATLN
jgi:hypothetical protein